MIGRRGRRKDKKVVDRGIWKGAGRERKEKRAYEAAVDKMRAR